MSNKMTHWIPNGKKIYINANYYVNKKQIIPTTNKEKECKERMKRILYHMPEPHNMEWALIEKKSQVYKSINWYKILWSEESKDVYY